MSTFDAATLTCSPTFASNLISTANDAWRLSETSTPLLGLLIVHIEQQRLYVHSGFHSFGDYVRASFNIERKRCVNPTLFVSARAAMVPRCESGPNVTS